jgi:hypothetical protein
MWTLRDLWMMLDKNYAQKWREEQAKNLQGQYHDGNMPQGLSEMFNQKRQAVGDADGLQQIYEPDEWIRQMDWAYQRAKRPSPHNQKML